MSATPADLPQPEVTRRGLLEGALVFSALLTVMPTALAAQSLVPSATEVLGAGELEQLALFADAIIPPTDTPGAVGAGVVDYISGLFAAVSQEERSAFLTGLAALSSATCDTAQDHLESRLRALLQAPANETEQVAAVILRQLKRLVMIGYYTSEVGGAQELVYAPVPGQYLPDVRVTPETRAFSNDTGALL